MQFFGLREHSRPVDVEEDTGRDIEEGPNGIVRAFKRARESFRESHKGSVKVAHMCGQSSNNYNEYNVCDKSRIKTQPARNVTSHARMHAARARARCTHGIMKRHRPRLLTSKASTEHMTPSLASRSLSERLSAGKSGWDEPTT